MSVCPCGAGPDYSACCGPLHDGEAHAETAKQLMRSRYAAYALGNVDYIVATTDPSKRLSQLRAQAEKWAANATFTGLDVEECVDGGPGDTTGIVQFTCRYQEKGKPHTLTERSRFRRVGKRWFYTEGGTPTAATVTRAAPKVGRNAPCPCGSGNKYKRCCGA